MPAKQATVSAEKVAVNLYILTPAVFCLHFCIVYDQSTIAFKTRRKCPYCPVHLASSQSVYCDGKILERQSVGVGGSWQRIVLVCVQVRW